MSSIKFVAGQAKRIHQCKNQESKSRNAVQTHILLVNVLSLIYNKIVLPDVY